MRIGIDIDGVLRDFTGSLQHQHRIDFPEIVLKPITDWGIEKFFPMGKHIYDYIYKYRAKEIFELAYAYDEAEWMMRELQRAGHDIWIITAQPRGTEQHTIRWLDVHDIEYDHLVFTNQKQHVECGTYLDDAPGYLQQLSLTGRNVVAFDRPWNQKWDGPRVKTHQEFLDLIERENHE